MSARLDAAEQQVKSLTAQLASAKEEIERLNDAWDLLHSECGSHIRKVVELETALSAERKETERLREHNTAMLLAVRRLKEAEARYDAAFTGDEFTAAHQETLDAVAAIYAAALQERQGEK